MGCFIPGCMGAAAAMGCGKTMSQVKEYCTCKYPDPPSLEGQIVELTFRIENLEKRLLKPHEL